MHDGVTTACEPDEIVLEKVGVDGFGFGRKSSLRRAPRDRTDVVSARDQSWDERAAEYACGARHENSHLET